MRMSLRVMRLPARVTTPFSASERAVDSASVVPPPTPSGGGASSERQSASPARSAATVSSSAESSQLSSRPYAGIVSRRGIGLCGRAGG